jgi:phosphoribosylglycinamide formyltransferase-1
MPYPRILVFASGGPRADEGGSGAEKLVKTSHDGVLKADIAAFVSNHPDGGVRRRAERLHVPFSYFEGPWTIEKYQRFMWFYNASHAALSGWLKLVVGLDPKTTFNIHPGLLPQFGGKGMFGHHVHEAVMKSYRECQAAQTAVCMHFVPKTKTKDEYDAGPVFFEHLVPIEPDDTPETLARRVNAVEHAFQPMITNLVVNGQISWDGENPNSLVVPKDYQWLPKDQPSAFEKVD